MLTLHSLNSVWEIKTCHALGLEHSSVTEHLPTIRKALVWSKHATLKCASLACFGLLSYLIWMQEKSPQHSYPEIATECHILFKEIYLRALFCIMKQPLFSVHVFPYPPMVCCHHPLGSSSPYSLLLGIKTSVTVSLIWFCRLHGFCVYVHVDKCVCLFFSWFVYYQFNSAGSII
jgi:hypothetical protein